ncbi:MAG: 50S ribosomal protein L21 [Candidatus Aminicenantales bacterium]
MYAVILTGGKQYRVKVGDLLSVEKLEAGQGETIHFDRVLLIEDGENILVGTPVLEDAAVRAEVIEQYKDEKVLVFKKKRRKQFRRTRGHRQQLTKVRVAGIFPDKSVAPAVEPPAPKPRPEITEKAPAPKKAAKAPEKAEAAPKKAAAKSRKAARDTRSKAAPKGKTVGKKTAALKTKKATKE